jgi:hypothetical protein
MSGPQEDLSHVIDALTAATQALTKATGVLKKISAEIGPQAGGALPAVAPPATISTWEDDPFSEASPTSNPPVSALIDHAVTAPSTNPGLSWQIAGAQPGAGRHQPGTPEFRYWVVQESLAGAVGHFVPLMPQGTRWSTTQTPMQVNLIAGNDLNARYSRFFGLRFYQGDVGNTRIFSGESPDIVRHELGHALLDAMRPELFDAASAEVDAFHEAFSDMTAMLSALRRPSYRQRVLAETQGRLRTNSRLSRLAEQLGWGIRQSFPNSVDPDSLRNAANRFSYLPPSSLLSGAPMTVLSSAPHSFARVFTGAFLDALAAMVDVAGGPDDGTLDTVSQDMAQLLVDGVLTAPVTPTYYSQVAAAMVQAAAARKAGLYQPALRGAFVGRGILDLVAARDLEAAAVPRLQPVQPAGPGGAAAAGPVPEGQGAARVLTYDGAMSDGYRADAASAPSLPQETVHAEFLDQPVVCHVAAEPERFHVSPFTVGPAAPTTDATESATQYIASLIQLGRIDPGRGASMVRGPHARDEGERHTHRLEDSGDGGLVLRRIQFQCLPRS